MPRLAEQPQENPARNARPSCTVERAAKIMDCDPSMVRRLVRQGRLEKWKLGKRGVRIFLDSIADYQDRDPNAERPGARAAPTRRRRIDASYAEARAYLAKHGIR